MADEKKKGGRPKKWKAAVSGKIGNGEGGYFEKGDELPEGCDFEGLKKKGLAE